jgi:hypothetical protein
MITGMGKVRYRRDIQTADKLLFTSKAKIILACVQEFDTIKLYRQKKETKRKNVQTQHSTLCKCTYTVFMVQWYIVFEAQLYILHKCKMISGHYRPHFKP